MYYARSNYYDKELMSWVIRARSLSKAACETDQRPSSSECSNPIPLQNTSHARELYRCHFPEPFKEFPKFHLFFVVGRIRHKNEFKVRFRLELQREFVEDVLDALPRFRMHLIADIRRG